MASKRKALSIETKMEILRAVDSGKKKKDVAKEFGIQASTLSTVLLLRKKIEESFTKSLSQDRKRFRPSTFPDVEEALLQWFKDVRARNLPVSGLMLEEKANSLAFLLGHEEFKANTGWVSRFKQRHEIVSHKLSGEASAVSAGDVESWTSLIQPILKEYAPKDIYNMDETGLFFKMMPDRSLSFKNETCHGGKKSKERITLVLAANSDGTDKRKVTVIGKSKKPRCFKGVNYLPVVYDANRKAWMTRILFDNWLADFEKDMKRQNRKVLLLLDNCSAHQTTMKLDAVRLQYLPPNTTSVLQPLDQGIIQSLKVHYRKRVVKLAVFNMDTRRETVINVKTAIDMVYGAWNSIDSKVIRNCFRKAKLVKQEADDCIEEEPASEEAESIDCLWQRLGLPDTRFEDFVNADQGLTTSPELTDKEIVDQVTGVSSAAEDSSDEEDAETHATPLTSVDSLKMLCQLKDYISSVGNVPESDISQCFLGLQKVVCCHKCCSREPQADKDQ